MISVILLIIPFQGLKAWQRHHPNHREPLTPRLIYCSLWVGQSRRKETKKGLGKDILVKCGTNPYLDRVENATRKAVFSDSCFRVSDSFWPKFSMCLNMTVTSYVAQYLGIGGLCCQKAFLAMETRECWPIGVPESLSTMWYLLMAETAVLTMEKEYFDSNRGQMNLNIRDTGAQ